MGCIFGINKNKLDIKLNIEEEKGNIFHKDILDNLESIDIKLNFSKEKINSTIDYSLKNIICENYISKNNKIEIKILLSKESNNKKLLQNKKSDRHLNGKALESNQIDSKENLNHLIKDEKNEIIKNDIKIIDIYKGSFKDIKSNFIIKRIFDNLEEVKLLKLIKSNKNL